MSLKLMTKDHRYIAETTPAAFYIYAAMIDKFNLTEGRLLNNSETFDKLDEALGLVIDNINQVLENTRFEKELSKAADLDELIKLLK